MGIFLETNEYLIIAALLITLLVATEIGFRSGRRRQSSENENTRFHIAALQGPLLGLLALMLGFTFSMALVLAVILDLDLPRQGLIKIKQDGMICLQREILRQTVPYHSGRSQE
jgi:hypothetical protein